MGAGVVLACRSHERGEAARRELEAETGNDRLSVMELDASRQASIRDFARELPKRHRQVHVLVNNAGLWSHRRQESVEGIELTWATNVLGYFLLCELLLDALRASAPARIVNVASRLARGLDLSDVEFKRRRYDGVAAYAQSKQAERMLTWALARRVLDTGVTANAVHPGGVATGIFAKGGGVKGFLGRSTRGSSARARATEPTPSSGSPPAPTSRTQRAPSGRSAPSGAAATATTLRRRRSGRCANR